MATVKITPHTYSADSDLKNLCAYIVDPVKTANGYYTFGRGVEKTSVRDNACTERSTGRGRTISL